MVVDNRTAKSLKADLIYILGYMTAKEEMENSPFEGTECHTIRRCLMLVEQARKQEESDGTQAKPDCTVENFKRRMEVSLNDNTIKEC